MPLRIVRVQSLDQRADPEIPEWLATFHDCREPLPWDVEAHLLDLLSVARRFNDPAYKQLIEEQIRMYTTRGYDLARITTQYAAAAEQRKTA